MLWSHNEIAQLRDRMNEAVQAAETCVFTPYLPASEYVEGDPPVPATAPDDPASEQVSPIVLSLNDAYYRASLVGLYLPDPGSVQRGGVLRAA